MLSTIELLEVTDFPNIRRDRTQTLQVNLGYRCNQTCVHCHVNAGPNRTEMMSDALIDLIPQVLKTRNIDTLDLTGGAPEMHPRFRELVRAARALGLLARHTSTPSCCGSHWPCWCLDACYSRSAA